MGKKKKKTRTSSELRFKTQGFFGGLFCVFNFFPPKPSLYMCTGRRKAEGGGGKDISLIWWGEAWISRTPSWPPVTLELGS